jgi:hypothetical protein
VEAIRVPPTFASQQRRKVKDVKKTDVANPFCSIINFPLIERFPTSAEFFGKF